MEKLTIERIRQETTVFQHSGCTAEIGLAKDILNFQHMLNSITWRHDKSTVNRYLHVFVIDF
jgi:hypothetical protein